MTEPGPEDLVGAWATTPARYGTDGCTCQPFTARTNPPRYLQAGEPVDQTTSWQQDRGCPHHGAKADQGDGDPRQAAYDAVYTHIRSLGDYLPPDRVHRNAIIWRAVESALKAAGVPELQPAGIDSGPSVAECAEADRRWFDPEREQP